MKQTINNFLNKQMDRKQFLQHLGLMLVSVIGLGSLLKYLSENGEYKKHFNKADIGYGGSLYGGIDKKS